jgi:hypothetical protein
MARRPDEVAESARAVIDRSQCVSMAFIMPYRRMSIRLARNFRLNVRSTSGLWGCLWAIVKPWEQERTSQVA